MPNFPAEVCEPAMVWPCDRCMGKGTGDRSAAMGVNSSQNSSQTMKKKVKGVIYFILFLNFFLCTSISGQTEDRRENSFPCIPLREHEWAPTPVSTSSMCFVTAWWCPLPAGTWQGQWCGETMGINTR